MAIFILLVCLLIAQQTSGTDSQSVPLSTQFQNPPHHTRIIKIIHNWPDAPDAQDSLISTLQRQGFGGVVCNVSFDQYLESGVKWAAFERAIKAARQRGFTMWLYDEKGYPSANAGGLVMRGHPDWEAEGLLAADAQTNGGEAILELPPGKLLLAAAFPITNGVANLKQSIDLSSRVSAGKLRWTAPAGQWRLLAITRDRLFAGTHAEMNLAAKMPYPNLLRPEPTQRFIELTHGGYAKHLGADLGRYFAATFTDEPSLMSLFLRPMPYRPLPWSPNLPLEFKQRRGYALEPLLPALVLDGGEVSRKTRHDFWKTVGDLVSKNYFGQIQEWCAAHQVPSGGHLLMEEGIVAHVPLYGDFFQCLRRLDAPGIDCLTSLPADVPWFIGRLAASAAELEGKTLVMCETSDHSQVYRPAGDQRPVRRVTEEEIRGTVNRLFVSGVNAITSYYSFAGLSDEQLRRLNEWVGRCGLMLQGGRQVADIAVLYPADSIWPRYEPARQGAGGPMAARRIEHLFRTAMDGLFASQREFTVIDARTLAESNVRDGSLFCRGLQWRVVVLPGTDTLSESAWKNLETFVRRGGVVVALGNPPANTDREFPSPRIQRLARQLFGSDFAHPQVGTNRAGGAGIFLPNGFEGMLPQVMHQILERELITASDAAALRMTHRRMGGSEIFFIINDSAAPWRGAVSLPVRHDGEFLDPLTGKTTPLVDGHQIPLNLPSYGAALLRFKEARPLRRLNPQNLLPAQTERVLSLADPLIARGEFVREKLIADRSILPDQGALWRARATLTKGNADTFLFLRLPCAPPLDLRGASLLALDTWVPSGQQTPNQLLVILHEPDGADYLAETGRALDASGLERTYIPLSQFHLAGWSKDANNQLDLERITEIRAGWGGYLGAEGEAVEFGLGPLRVLGQPAGE